MKGEPEIIKHLNSILKNELTAINQYFLHSKMLKDWGVERLAKKVYEESIGEMKHADAITERILMLDGLPNLQDLGRLNIGETVPEILLSDLKSEVANQEALKGAIISCEKANDYISREMLKMILSDTEEHIDWIEAQQTSIRLVGIENYIQENLREG